MTNLARIRVTWQNFAGAPGVSTFYSTNTTTPNLGALTTFFGALTSYLPNGLTVQVQNTGDIIDDATGTLTGSWGAATQAVKTGTATGGYTGSTGMIVHWRTAGIHNGRRLRGTTFIVPLSASWLTGNGVVPPTVVSAVKTQADALVTAASTELSVWGRPRKARAAGPGGKPPAVDAAPGSSSLIVGADVPQLAAVLRTRRD